MIDWTSWWDELITCPPGQHLLVSFRSGSPVISKVNKNCFALRVGSCGRDYLFVQCNKLFENSETWQLFFTADIFANDRFEIHIPVSFTPFPLQLEVLKRSSFHQTPLKVNSETSKSNLLNLAFARDSLVPQTLLAWLNPFFIPSNMCWYQFRFVEILISSWVHIGPICLLYDLPAQFDLSIRNPPSNHKNSRTFCQCVHFLDGHKTEFLTVTTDADTFTDRVNAFA